MSATPLAPGLYVVATPIGNLADFSDRARTVLAGVDLILAEDTRVTRTLLGHCGLRTPMRALHDHNEARTAGDLIERLAEGGSLALVSDAGTPAISDPGARIVARAHAAGVPVIVVPGPSAAAAAVSAAGFEGPFLFYGFAPERPVARRKALEALRATPWTLVFFEAPHRVLDTVDDLTSVLGPERVIVIARELTKRFESIRRLPLGEAGAWLRSDANHVRGEFVLVVAGAGESAPGEAEAAESERVLHALLEALPLSQAVALACRITGERRNVIYERALAWRRAQPARGDAATTDDEDTA